MKVWVASFVPDLDLGGVGGFEWTYKQSDLADRISILVDALDATDTLTVRTVTIPAALDTSQDITNWLDENLDF